MPPGEIAQAIQNIPFFTAIRESGLPYPIILSTHLSCIAVFGGLILISDLRLLGLALTNVPVSEVLQRMCLFPKCCSGPVPGSASASRLW